MKKSIILISFICVIVGGSILLKKYYPNKYVNNNNNQEQEKINETLNDKQENANINNITESYDYEIMMNNMDMGATDPEALFNISGIVVIADYQRDVSVKVFESGTPFTISEFKIEKILKNTTNYEIGKDILVRYPGGIVSMEEILKVKGKDFGKKMGIDNSTEIQPTAKFKYSLGDIGDRSFKEHSKRILFINYNKYTNDYVIEGNQFGMVSYENNTIFDARTKKQSDFAFLK